MISKSLFVRLWKEDLKRRIWTLAIFCLIFLLILPIICALNLEETTLYKESKLQDVIDLMGPAYYGVTVVTVIGAIVSGLSGFFYLQSRKKVDLYHSIPVRREELFLVSYLNGFLVYVVPYLMNVIFCFIIIGLKHYMYPSVFAAALAAIGINLLYFCLIYTITIIAVMLTGNIIVSFLGCGVFLSYGPMLVGIKESYYSSFFQTYYNDYNRTDLYTFLSPIGSYVTAISKYINQEDCTATIIKALIALALCVVVAVILYKKRPSEAAGNAMAFHITKPIIKFLLVVPIALGGGVLFRSIVSTNSDGWFIFGIIFTLVIIYAIVQVIFQFDIRCAFAQKKHLLSCAIIIGLIACVFRFDLLGINTYIPKTEDIESMGVYISGLDQNMETYLYVGGRSEYISYQEYQLKNMKLTDFGAAYDLAKLGIQSLDKMKESYDYAYTDIYSNYTYIIKYNLKNGKSVYRSYKLSSSDSKKLIKSLYENNQFKEYHFPINQCKEEEINRIIVSYASETLNYTESDTGVSDNLYIDNSNQIAKLYDIYTEELNSLSFEEKSNAEPVAEIEFDAGENNYSGYYVYPSFTKTISYLEEQGFNLAKTISLPNIIDITVYKYNYDYSNNTASGDIEPITYTDTEKISEIVPGLIDYEFYQNNKLVENAVDGIEAVINYRTGGTGQIQSFSYVFRSDKMPEFVKKDLGISS